MSTATEHRKLAAIMFTDMVGYSALAQRNEALAIELIAEQRVLLRGLLLQHAGREVKSTGDGFMLEFPSALAATQCAVAFQKAAASRNATAASERRFEMRVGLHLGDVVGETGGDIHGDGVNIAARIEPLAQPGGICVSRAVADQVANKIEWPLVKLAATSLKNIATPVEVFRVVLPWLATDDRISKRRAVQRLKRFLPQAFVLLLVLGIAVWLAWRVGRNTAPVRYPTYRALATPVGTIYHARFTPDGGTVAYSARREGGPLEAFLTRCDSPESRWLGLTNADVLAISSAGELAVLLDAKPQGWFICRGTLARMPVAGGTPRPWIPDVQEADWSRDGAELAVVRWVEGGNVLEFPAGQGKALVKTAGYLSNPRVSPDGRWVAFLEHPFQWDDRGWVVVVDRDGNQRRLTQEWVSLEGLAWAPGGKEIWFGASHSGEPWFLEAVTLAGKQRQLTSDLGGTVLQDVSLEGRVLATRTFDFSQHFVQLPGEAHQRSLDLPDQTIIMGISPDAQSLLLQFWSEGTGSNYVAGIVKVDGTSPVRLGEGRITSMSPDGRWVATMLPATGQIHLLPTGAGEPKTVPTPGLNCTWAHFLPDGKRLLLCARETGKGFQMYVQDIAGTNRHVLTSARVRVYNRCLSPDGRHAFAYDEKGVGRVYPLGDGEAKTIPGLGDADAILGWASDSESLFVTSDSSFPVRVERLELATGKRTPLCTIAPPDLAGDFQPAWISLAPDGQTHAYSVYRLLCRLYVAEGIK